jgi:hypothetical protein
MMYRSLTDIADDVADAVRATKAFRAVSTASIDSYSQLVEQAKAVKLTPAAIICLGSGRWSDHRLKREFKVAVVVFSAYKRNMERKSDAVWTLAEAAAEPFLPVFEPAALPVWPEINGVEYELLGWQPLSLDEKTASFILEINAVEVAKESGESS